MNSTEQKPDQQSGRKSLWHRLRSGLVTVFVCWHLLFLVITNSEVDQLIEPWREKTESVFVNQLIDCADVTCKSVAWYETMTGMDQGWGMFGSPLARRAPFLSIKLVFGDGSTAVLDSTRQPSDAATFLRFGEMRLRKYEDYLLNDLEGTFEFPMVERYAELAAARWRRENPQDGRRPVTAILLKRYYELPSPGERWESTPKTELEEFGRVKLKEAP